MDITSLMDMDTISTHSHKEEEKRGGMIEEIKTEETLIEEGILVEMVRNVITAEKGEQSRKEKLIRH